jgi:hypothetical protein
VQRALSELFILDKDSTCDQSLEDNFPLGKAFMIKKSQINDG